MKETRDWRTLLSGLEAEELIDSQGHVTIVETLTAVSDDKDNPWYVQVLVMASAWLAAMLIIMSLFEFEFMNNEMYEAVTGLIFITLATVARWKTNRRFIVQLALAISIAGQFFVLMGMFGPSENYANGWAALFCVEVVLFFVYADALHRFLSIVLAVMAAAAWLYTKEVMDGVHILIALLTFGAGYLWINECRLVQKWSTKLHEPLAYGTVIALLSVLIFSITEESITLSLWWISTIILTFGMLYVGDRVVRSFDTAGRNRARILFWVATIVIAVTTLQAPGIVASLFVLLLGFHRGSRIMTVTAFLFLAVFLIAFFYNLELTLLAKSIILMASGLILLVLRVVINSIFKGENHVAEAA